MDNLSLDRIVDAAQTAALLATMGILLWGVVLLRREFLRVARSLDAVLRRQKEIQDAMAEVTKRVEELEKKDRARQIGWLNSDEAADDDGCGFSRAMPPIDRGAEEDSE